MISAGKKVAEPIVTELPDNRYKVEFTPPPGWPEGDKNVNTNTPPPGWPGGEFNNVNTPPIPPPNWPDEWINVHVLYDKKPIPKR